MGFRAGIVASDLLLLLILIHSSKGLSERLRLALDGERRGSPTVCIVRILHEVLVRPEIVDNIALGKSDTILQLKRCLHTSSGVLPKDAALFVELLKKIFLFSNALYIDELVRNAINANLPNFILDKILSAEKSDLVDVQNPSALRIYSVDLLKAIITVADESNALILQNLLDAHPAWKEFRDQSHDLFLTVKLSFKLSYNLKYFFYLGSRKN
jgi:hypothetical protein